MQAKGEGKRGERGGGTALAAENRENPFIQINHQNHCIFISRKFILTWVSHFKKSNTPQCTLTILTQCKEQKNNIS
jgi:hypothetical protein